MKLVIFTIVLDGMPFIEWQYECFKKLKCDWKWIVAEGAAQNNGSTRWCKPQEERCSTDGTIEFLRSIEPDKRVYSFGLPVWESKDAMVNAALSYIHEPCVLMQIDVDEIWKPNVIDEIPPLFEESTLREIKVLCRYFVGPKLVCEGTNCWSSNDYEWLRVWRFEPGMFFETHEPPRMKGGRPGRTMGRLESQSCGLTFDHLSYIHEKQVAYKEQFYGYTGLVNQWRALQRNTVWPAKLSRFFPFVHGQLPVVHKIA